MLAARSCSPRRSRSVTSGGITVISRMVRTQSPAEPHRPAVQPGHPDAQHPLAQGEPGQRGKQPDLHGEDRQGPARRVEERQRHAGARQPVDQQGEQAAPHARDRPGAVLGKAELFSRVLLLIRGVPRRQQPGPASFRHPLTVPAPRPAPAGSPIAGHAGSSACACASRRVRRNTCETLETRPGNRRELWSETFLPQADPPSGQLLRGRLCAAFSRGSPGRQHVPANAVPAPSREG